MADRHTQSILDMTEMLIELSTEILQLGDIVRLERNGDKTVLCC
ncbi:hypothetical protein [Allohahella marinimesophila]